MLLMQCILTCLILLTPFFVGFLYKKENPAEAYLYGQVLLWAVFQLLAVPIVFFRLPFNALCAAYAVLLVVLTAWGARSLLLSGNMRRKIKIETPYSQYLPFLLALCVILFQASLYVVGMHLDEDDSRFIVEANDAITKNTMYLHNPATGEYIGRFVGEMKKDIFSPWAMYIAALSRLTMLKPAVFAHTVYAPVLLLLSYIIYVLIGRQLFNGRFEQGVFVLAVSVINMFFVGSAYSQAAFSLIRIWQGKAAIAAIMIPLFLLLLLELQEKDSVANWLWLATAACAACLFSGMGVALSAIMVAVYGGYAVIRGRFRRFPLLLLAMLPPAVFGLLYFWWR